MSDGVLVFTATLMIPLRRDTGGYVFARYTGMVERVQSHLSHRFADRLSTKRAAHLTWMNDRLIELRLCLA